MQALRRNVRFTQLSNPEEDDIDRGPVALALAYVGRFLLDQAKILDRALTKTGLYAKLTIEGPVSEALMVRFGLSSWNKSGLACLGVLDSLETLLDSLETL